MLKLRVSYGIGGNIAKDTWPYMTAYYSTNTKPGIGGISGSISSRPNPNLRWEKTTTVNVGFDFAIFNNRLNGSVDIYNKKGTDLLANSNGVSVEGQGYSTTTINNGEMTNRGVELNISGTVFTNRDWTWSMQGVLSYNKSKVDYVNVEAPVGFLQIDQPQAFPRVGDPFNSIYGYRYAGLDENGIPGVYYANGDIEKNNYYGMSLDDIVYLGNNVPTYSGSLSTTLRWRDFTLSALMLFEGGHQLNVPYYTYNDRWHQPGDEAFTDIPRYVSGENPDFYSNIELYTKSSAAVKDADNIRIRNISLSYNLPRNICSKFYAQGLRLTAGIENVATFAKSKQVKYALGDQIVCFYADAYDPATAAQTPGVPLIYSGDLGAPWHQGSVEEVYGRILSDFHKAIELGVPEQSMTVVHPGRAAVEAGLARVYLHMRDYENALTHAEEALRRKSDLFDWIDYYNKCKSQIENPTDYNQITSPLDPTCCENLWFCSGNGNPNYPCADTDISIERRELFETGDAKALVRFKKYTSSSDTSIAAKYNVSAVPTMYLVDADGCLVAENLRGEVLAEKVAEMLK